MPSITQARKLPDSASDKKCRILVRASYTYANHKSVLLLVNIMHIIVLDLDGQSHTHSFEEGDNLMQLLTEHGYEEVRALCGGCCSCATCHVHVAASASIYPAEGSELDMLELVDGYDEALSRLSCQIVLDYANDGMRVQLVAPS